MNILIMSDLHLDCDEDKGLAFANSLSSENIDVLILAGDISCGENIPITLKYFCQKFNKVIYVHGNHEYYGAARKHIISWTFDALAENSNLIWLNNDIVEVDGVRFIGSTLWFQTSAQDYLTSYNYNDFIFIPSFEDWIFSESIASREFLQKNVSYNDIIISHFLPTKKSLYGKYKLNYLNNYYINDLEDLILDRQPKMWVHGHTHQSSNYFLNKTKIICNPKGHDFDEPNLLFDNKLIFSFIKI
jgi:predicted phosphodiesterase